LYIGSKAMKVVCAPASFKESLTAADAAAAMARGVDIAAPSALCEQCPVGDGGEGTLHVLQSALGATSHTITVRGPLGLPTRATFATVPSARIGIVELAQASGLELVPPPARDPLRSTTYGTGELIAAAVAENCRSIIVCIGGSATVDGGAGLAQALGARFYDAGGQLIEQPMCGGLLIHLSRVDPPPKLPPIRVACDVTNPLCGASGAAAIYGPQKGAKPEQIQLLEEGLTRLASVVGGDPLKPGAGAAGGAGFGLATLCGATLQRGIDLVLNLIDFDRRCRGASLVLTGEGRLDSQSLHGKACMGVAAAAAQHGVPTIAIVGSTGPGAEMTLQQHHGLRRYVSLSDRFGLERAMSQPASLLTELTGEIVREELRC
jgi:glycerate kinase